MAAYEPQAARPLTDVESGLATGHSDEKRASFSSQQVTTSPHHGSVTKDSEAASYGNTNHDAFLDQNLAHSSYWGKITTALARYNVESVSVAPVPVALRKSKQWWSVPMLWFSANFNILSFSTGTLVVYFDVGPAAAYTTIILTCFFSSLFPAYFVTFGPPLGLRQMIHTRYSWGWFAPLIAILNAATLCGYTILNCIVGGQTISAVSPNGSLTPTVGIVIVAVVSLLVCFCGIRLLHLTERWMWAPVLVCFCILIGLAGTGSDGLHFDVVNAPPTTSYGVLSMVAIIIGFLVPWSGIACDVTTYLDPETTPSFALFVSSFFGYFMGSCPLFLAGAAFALSSLDIPDWSDALYTSNGALFNLIMSNKTGGFGKFVTVLLGLSVYGNAAASIYSFGLSMQAIVPPFRYIPRFVFTIVIAAIVIPLSIVGASTFYETLTDFLAVLGYWAALYVGVVLADHVVIRRCDWSTYNPEHWDSWRTELPIGIAAMTSACISLAILIPSVDQTFFVGPLAAHVGDLAFELSFVVCFLLYIPLRMLEKKVVGR